MNNDLMNTNCIVFGAEHFNTLGVIRSLGEEGIRPFAVIIKSKLKIASTSRYCKKVFLVESIEEGYKFILSQWNKQYIKSIIITSDDRTTSFLDLHYDDLKYNFVFFNAGKKGRLTDMMQKNAMCDIAALHQLRVPSTYEIINGNIPKDLQYPVIIKADNSLSIGWKEITHICENETQLNTVLRRLKKDRVVIQRYIEKKNELCLDGYAWNKGRNIFVGIASNYKYVLPKEYSHFMDVYNFKNSDLYESLRSIFKEIGFEGIFSVEFLIDKNDNLYFLEINFRNSTWSYASTRAGMNLVVGWCRAMIEGDAHHPYYNSIKDGFTAIDEISDFKSRVISRKISLKEWICDVKNSTCTYYYNHNDKMPFFSAVATKVISKL